MESKRSKQAEFYSFKDLTSDYYQVLIAKRRPMWCKCLWALITIGFLSMTVYMVYSLVKNYLEYSSYNEVSVSWNKSLSLPAITICSTNYLNYTDWNETIGDNNTIKYYLEQFFIALESYNGTVPGGITNFIDPDIVQMFDEWITAVDGKQLDMFHDFKFEPEQYLLGDGDSHAMYIFAGKWKMLNLNITNVGSHKYGSCILLNDDQALVQVLGGKQGGLTIDLDAKIADYLPITSTKGFQVYLRNPNETLLIDKGGILVTPGTENFLSLNKYEVTRLGPRFGKCENVPSNFVPTIAQSVRECLQEAWFDIAVDECNCVPWYLLDRLEELNLTEYTDYWYNLVDDGQDSNDTYKNATCGFATQALCDVQVLEFLIENVDGTVCPEPCYFEEWDWDLTVAEFPPSEDYYDLILQNSLSYGDYSYDWARENFIRLHIYYDDIKVTKVTQETAYEIFNFIAELGGTVDLLIGFSFFTVFQILEIMVAFCVYNKFQKRRHEDVPRGRPEFEFEPGLTKITGTGI